MTKILNWQYPVWLEHEFAKVMNDMGDEGMYVYKDVLVKNRQLAYEIRDVVDYMLDRWQTPWMEHKDAKLPEEEWYGWYTDCKTTGYWHVPQADVAGVCKSLGYGRFKYLKAPFTKAGNLSALAEKWLVNVAWQTNNWIKEENIYYTADSVWGPFSRIDWIDRNPNSDPQKKAWLFQLGWIPTEWNYDKENRSLKTSPKITESSFASLPDKQLGKLLKLRGQVQDRINIFDRVELNIREDGTVRTGGDTLGTATGRMAHKVIVNLPGGKSYYARYIRQCLGVKPGRVMVAADASSCQLRLLCHYMNDPKYTKAVMTGQAHTENAKLLGLHKSKAKKFIFALLFGAGDDKLSADTGGDGATLRATFMDKLPKFAALIKNLNQACKDRGYLKGIDGRMIQVDKKHKQLCYLLQSAEAVLMKTAAVVMDRWIKEGDLDAKIIWHYHDEYAYSVLPGQEETVKELLEDAITEAGNMIGLKVPHVGEGAVGYNMWETH